LTPWRTRASTEDPSSPRARTDVFSGSSGSLLTQPTNYQTLSTRPTEGLPSRDVASKHVVRYLGRGIFWPYDEVAHPVRSSFRIHHSITTAGCVDTDLPGCRNRDQSDRFLSGAAHRHHAMQVNNTETSCRLPTTICRLSVPSILPLVQTAHAKRLK